MGELQVFKNREFGEIRTIEIDGQPWFVGKDVADILGYQNGSRDISRHVDKEDKLTGQFGWSGQNRKMIIINESGLYSLIFASKMPRAKEFTRWVTAEVLPSIRRTGAYGQAADIRRSDELRSYIYLGQVCYTIRSFAEYSGLHRRTIADYIHRRRLLDKVDYVVLRGEELMSFRLSNPQLVEKSSSLMIIFESGAEKLFGQPVSEVVSVPAQVQVAHPRRGDELTELLRTQILLQQEILSLLTKPAM